MFLLKLIYLTLNYIYFVLLNLMQKILILVLNLFMLSFFLSLIIKSSWMSMIFIMLMVSGLMVMFIYVTSLNPLMVKEKKKLSMIYYMIYIIMVMKLYYLSTFSYFHFKESFFLNLYNSLTNSIEMLTLIVFMLIMLLFYMEFISSYKTSLRL